MKYKAPYHPTFDTYFYVRGLSPKYIAAELEIKKTDTVNGWRRGVKPQRDHRLQLAVFLRVEPKYVYDLYLATQDALNDTPEQRIVRLLATCVRVLCDSIPLPRHIDLLLGMLVRLARARLTMKKQKAE